MNTGADDDSLSTPTFAFSKSSARASPVAPIASRPAKMSRIYPGRALRARLNCIIQFSPSLFSKPSRDRLILPEKGPLLFQLYVQFVHGDIAGNRIAIK